MKNSNFKLFATVMFVLAVLIALPTFSSAANVLQDSDGPTAKIKGKISHSFWIPGVSSSVTISAIPKTVEEFQQLQEQIGKEPQGAVALEIIAIEMYRQLGKEIGEKCLKICNTDNNVGSVKSRIKELFREGDSYGRPYQMAAFMKGASPQNGYNPEKPYVIEVFVDKTEKYQESSDYGSKIIFLQVKSHGHGVGSQRVYVVKPEGAEYYLVDNCPGLYTQVQKIGYGKTFEGL